MPYCRLFLVILQPNTAKCFVFCNMGLASVAMKKLRKTINIILWSLVALYAAIILMLNLPPVQKAIGGWTSDAIGKKINSRVEIGKVDVGFFNRIIIDDVSIYDQKDSLLLASSRVSAKFDVFDAIKGNVSITSAQLFGLKAYLSKDSANAPFNFQFILDSLASKEKKEPSRLNLHIGSLIIRNGLICYDQKDAPVVPGKFSPKHLQVYDISSHIILHKLTQDSLNLHLKKLSLKEKSGLEISSLTFKAKATKNNATLSDFLLKMPSSQIALGETKLKYDTESDKPLLKTLDFSTSIADSHIGLSDLAAFSPNLRDISRPIDIAFNANCHGENLVVNDLSIKDQGGEMSLFANGSIYDFPTFKDWMADVKYLRINENYIESIGEVMKGEDITMPSIVERIGDFGYIGTISNHNSEYSVAGKLTSNVGNVAVNGSYGNNVFGAKINTDGIDLGRLLNNEQLGDVATTIDIDGHLHQGRNPDINAVGKINRLFYNGYTYRDIDVNGSMIADVLKGKLSIDDPNVSFDTEGEVAQNHVNNLTLNIKRLNPNALGLTNKWQGTSFSGNIKGNFSGNSIDTAIGNLTLEDFRMESSADSVYRIKNVTINCDGNISDRHVQLYGDFGQVNIDGQYRVSSLPSTITRLIATRLPSLPGLPKTASAKSNEMFTIDARLRDASILQEFADIPLITQEPISLKGTVDQSRELVDLTLDAPQFLYDDAPYRNLSMKLFTDENGALKADASADKIMGNGHTTSLIINASAINDRLLSNIGWDNHMPNRFSGNLNSDATFAADEGGKTSADITILPSTVVVGDTIWNVDPANVKYSSNRLEISNFSVNHGNQHVNINGLATRSSTDSLVVNLHDVNAKYVLDMLNFHSVDFDGFVSGKAIVSSIFGEPELRGDVTVRDFTFEQGRMGTLKALVDYDNQSKQININARADDGPLCQTLINGYVSPAKKHLDLRIKAMGTSAEFMEGLCGSFLDNVQASANGNVHIFGPLKAINMEGDINVDGDVKIPALNTVYTMRNCPVVMRPDIIILNTDSLTDRDGNIGILNGSIRHHNLSQWIYDINVAANNLLAFDFHDFGESTFFGTVYATGTCDITGRSGETTFDIDITPQKGSFFEYNAAAPDAISNTDFIEWVRHDKDSAVRDGEDEEKNKFRSDIRMNFHINATTDAALKLLMDNTTGDMITLYGNGNLRAMFHNKGGFQMFGNYQIDHGTYGLTIQNVIKKDFFFKSGGTIVFGGDPYNAALNLKAQYTVNGVPLSDLQLGKSFSNNVRVDCIMNISGTPNDPHLDFDFDMPTVNEDAKQMVRSLINSEEELNQQVIYLLSIGRFYSQSGSNSADAQQSQTSLAMQSILSGTITQQINTVLSNVVNNSNWNFGANISTGDEGFNNAEYEGILSGRLLNNRLLINGQFGYRDNANATTSFIGDFDIRYLLFPNGNFAVRVYNQTNDRYFTRNSLTTQGVGFIIQKDFTTLPDLFGIKKKKKAQTKVEPADSIAQDK